MNILSPANIFQTKRINYGANNQITRPKLAVLPYDCVCFSGNKISPDFDFASKFSPKDMETIKSIAEYGAKAGVNVFLVGGVVRDMLLGKPANDLDFMIEGDAAQFAKGLLKEHPDYIPDYLKNDFGTAKIKINGTDIDIASTREESYIRKAIPTVKNIGCPMAKDIKRRDFTINSIALQVVPDGRGGIQFEIKDLMGGIDDLNAKKLRVTYKKSFEDDPTRIIRGLKFRLRYGFEYDKDTKKLQDEYLKNPPREQISKSRIDTTLRKLFENENTAPKAFKMLIDEGIYKLYTEKTAAKPEWGEKIKESAKLFGADNHTNLYMATLNDKKTEGLLNIFKGNENPDNYTIYKTLKKLSKEELVLYYAITGDTNAVKFKDELSKTKLFINGRTLLAMGKKGKEIGILLEKLMKEKLNTDNLKTENDEIEFIKRCEI